MNKVIKIGAYGCLIPTVIMFTVPILWPWYMVGLMIVGTGKVIIYVYRYFTEPVRIVDMLDKLPPVDDKEILRPTPDGILIFDGGIIEIHRRTGEFVVLDNDNIEVGSYPTFKEAKEKVDDLPERVLVERRRYGRR